MYGSMSKLYRCVLMQIDDEPLSQSGALLCVL